MRLRSSLRCSKKVIAPAGSSAGVVICELDSGSGTDSGRILVVMVRIFGTQARGILGLGVGGLFRGAWNGFGNRGGHRVFDGTRFSLSLDRRRFRVSGPSRGRRWAGLGGRRSGGSLGSLLAFGLERLALHIAHLLFEGALKISRGLAELGHELAEPSGKLRQLLWSENDQDHDT